jgi:hypothetical protein
MTVVAIKEILGSNPTAVTVSKIETIGSPSILTASNMKTGGKPNPEMIDILYMHYNGQDIKKLHCNDSNVVKIL